MTAKPKAATATKAKPAAPARRPSRPKVPHLDVIVQSAVRSLEDDKAEDVVVLDVASRAAFADRIIVATGLADRQIQAMAAHLEKALAEHGIRRIRTETSADWVLLDAGDLIVHLFKPEARANYRLEKMWGPDSPPPDDLVMPAGDVPPEPPPAEDDFIPSLEAFEDEEDEDDDEDDEDDADSLNGPGDPVDEPDDDEDDEDDEEEEDESPDAPEEEPR
ncbi:ribosome silencing factor [Roseomonas sp. KE0001]|nr:ribosome silencing factor [Roseomonas sp. KE0001]